MRKVLVIAFVLFTGIVNAQNWEPVTAEVVKGDLIKLSDDLRSQGYSLLFDRKVYAHYTDATPVAHESGRFVRGVGNEYASMQPSQLTIQNAEVKMMVDSSLGTIVLVRPDSLFLPVDMSLFNSVADFNFRTMKKDGFKVFELVPVKEGTGMSELQLWLRGDGSLARVIIYLPKGNYQQQTMDDISEELPMVVMNYEKKTSVVEKQLFTLSTWLVKGRNGYELLPALTEKYTLSDLRYTPQKN